jgi:hypothetical protein
MKKTFLILLLFVSVFAAGCATEDWNTSGSQSPSGYRGGQHH